jgi:hypothetical protein
VTERHYGWIPDRPDFRDQLFAAPRRLVTALPAAVDLRPLLPPIYDQGRLGSCFPPGTRVRMADGTERCIETIHPLEQVLTAEGRIGTVRAVMGRLVQEDIIKLKVWGHNYLRMTEEHPVLTRRGYVAAKDVRLDDWVAMPRYLPERQTVIQTEGHVRWRERVRATGKRDYSGVVGRGGVSVAVKAVPDFIELTPGVGRILGLFLSEGNTDKTKVVWSFGEHEKDTLVAELVELLRAEWGVEARVQPRPNSCVKVNLYGTAWAKLFESLCATGAGMKRLHSDIAAGPHAFMEALLQGWLDGDGWHSSRGESGVSISHDLTLSMFDIAQALGRRPAINWGKPTESPGVKVRQPRWTVEMCSKSDNWRVEQDDTHVWRKVRALEREPYEGPVFNLSVEGDESYVTEGIGVHNCTAHGTAALIQFDQKKQGLPSIMPSRLFAYYNSRMLENSTQSDSGASIRDSLKAIAKYGFLPEERWPYVVEDFAKTPPNSIYDEALPGAITDYATVTQTPEQIKGVLASGLPITFGFTVYSSFESAAVTRTGDVPMPRRSESVLGGHCVVLAGYDDKAQMYWFRNPWGTDWGNEGYGRFPYAFVHSSQISSDFWVINTIPGAAPAPPSPPPPPPPPPEGDLAISLVLDGRRYDGRVTEAA